MLFDITKNEKPSAAMRGAFASMGAGTAHSLQSMQDIEHNIGKLRQAHSYHFWSRGQWSMHELLEYLLAQTGPAEVWMTTWTVTEDPVRKLFLLKEAGIIQSLNCVLDYRIKGRKPKPFQLLEQTADVIKLTECHAKSLVLVNEDWKVSVVGSANFSRNPRLEAGVISTQEEIAMFNLNTIKHEMDR